MPSFLFDWSNINQCSKDGDESSKILIILYICKIIQKTLNLPMLSGTVSRTFRTI